MRVLLDEQIHRLLAERFGAEFEVRAVLEVGWGSLKNGALQMALPEASPDSCESIRAPATGSDHVERGVKRWP
jgi:hypothetical protein